MFKLHMPCRGACRNPRRALTPSRATGKTALTFVVGISNPRADFESYRRKRENFLSAPFRFRNMDNIGS